MTTSTQGTAVVTDAASGMGAIYALPRRLSARRFGNAPSHAVLRVCAGSRAIGDDPCFGLARMRRHLSHRRDVGRACFRLQHCDRKFEWPTIGSSPRYSRYTGYENADGPTHSSRMRKTHASTCEKAQYAGDNNKRSSL